MTLDCPKISLKQGSSGSSVKELQEALKKLGYYNANVDSSYGPVTKKAVIAFQKRYGLAQDGWFGPVSCQKLTTVAGNSTSGSSTDVFDCPNTSLKKGSKEKTKVTTLQKYLKEWGYYEKSVDGDYGSYTELAIKDFQKEVGETADGWFGPKTCKHLVARAKGQDEEEKNPYVIGSKIREIPLYARYLKGTLTMFPEVVVEEEEEVTVTTTSSSTDTSSSSSSSSTDTGGSGAGSYNDLDSGSSDSSDSSSTESSSSSQPTTTTTTIKRFKIVEIGKGKASKNGGGLDCTNISLKRGSSGEDVKTLQTGLAKMGYYTKSIDGDYGEKTEAAVKQLQAATGQTVDGWFGSKTCPEFNKKLGIDTSKVASKPSFTITDLINPNPNSDVEGLTHDCTLRTVYTQEKLSKIQVMQRCKLELLQDIDVVYTLDGYVNDLKIVQESGVMYLELTLTGYSAFLEQDFADYGGNKKQSEHLKAICEEIGLMLKLDLNGLKDEDIELNKVTVTGSGGTGSGGGSIVQMSNNDCDASDSYQSGHWANHRTNPPRCTASSKQMRGNSDRQYARDTASHNSTTKELVEYVQGKCQYQLYADNPYGSSRCPDAMWKSGSSGKIRGNCADYARMLKCILDVNGYKSIICHIPGHYYNAIWENGDWTVCDLCRVLYGDSAYGHANHGNIKPKGTWDNPVG